jgi:hypothetical protein
MNKVDIIAVYFPQFHAIKENNEWWGEGFTDWEHVKDAQPLFENHYQPRIPIDEDYYNPCDKSTLLKQVEIARKYGISGFLFYHYWFDGKLLLEKPLEVLLNNPDIDIPFSIAWANESWTKAWKGLPEEILQRQLHKPDKSIWTNHFNYLLPFLKDKRSIKINDMPTIFIYQPFLIKHTKEMFDLWRQLAKENGLKGLYLVAFKNHQFISKPDFLQYYDAILKFQPREAYNSNEFRKNSSKIQLLRKLPYKVQNWLRKIQYYSSGYEIIDSKKIWEIIIKNAIINPFPEYKLDVFESAYFDWDNTPRYGKKAKIFNSLSFDEKEAGILRLAERCKEKKSKYIFFNAWNEWSESAYLEPDKKNEYKHLEIIRNILKKVNE